MNPYRVYDKSNECYEDDIDDIYIYPNGELVVIEQDAAGENCFGDSDNYIVEMGSGLFDKNDKMIYVGDIIRVRELDENSAFGYKYNERIEYVCFGGGQYPGCFTVKHQDFYQGYTLLCHELSYLDVEIIGNIHDNSNLLKKAKKSFN